MQSSYRARGQIEGNADLINTKAYIGHNEGTLGNTLNLLATLYKGYKNIPAHIRWKLFGDQMALLEDQRSKDGGVIDPTTGDYYTLPFQDEYKEDDTDNNYRAEVEAGLSELEDLEPPDKAVSADMPVSVEPDTSFDVSGMTKNDIRKLQKELIAKKFLEPTYTTKFGKKARSDDGVFGSETLRGYQAYLDAGNQYGEDEWSSTDLRTPTDEVRMYGRTIPTSSENKIPQKQFGELEDMSDEIRTNQLRYESSPFQDRPFEPPFEPSGYDEHHDLTYPRRHYPGFYEAVEEMYRTI